MTLAGYGHLRIKALGLLAAIAMSWLLALPEYAIQVPANRLGDGWLTAYQLKILQEVITLIVFVVYARLALGQSMKRKHLVSFALMHAAVLILFENRTD